MKNRLQPNELALHKSTNEDIEANIDNWLLSNGKAQPKVPTATYVPGCSLSEGLDNIITQLKRNVNLLYET